MAVFATDAIVDGLKCLRAEFRLYIQGVTVQTAIGFVGCIRETEDFGHTQGDGIGKNAVGARMLVLGSPNAVLILRDAGDSLGLHCAMAIAGGTGTGTAIFADFTGLFLR